MIVAMLLGSMASRAITGNAPFVPTITATLVLIVLHRVLASLAFRSHRFGLIVKGHVRPLVQDGKFVRDEMRATHVTQADIMEALRLRGLDKIEDVKAAHLERSGNISVIERS